MLRRVRVGLASWAASGGKGGGSGGGNTRRGQGFSRPPTNKTASEDVKKRDEEEGVTRQRRGDHPTPITAKEAPPSPSSAPSCSPSSFSSPASRSGAYTSSTDDIHTNESSTNNNIMDSIRRSGSRALRTRLGDTSSTSNTNSTTNHTIAAKLRRGSSGSSRRSSHLSGRGDARSRMGAAGLGGGLSTLSASALFSRDGAAASGGGMKPLERRQSVGGRTGEPLSVNNTVGDGEGLYSKAPSSSVASASFLETTSPESEKRSYTRGDNYNSNSAVTTTLTDIEAMHEKHQDSPRNNNSSSTHLEDDKASKFYAVQRELRNAMHRDSGAADEEISSGGNITTTTSSSSSNNPNGATSTPPTEVVPSTANPAHDKSFANNNGATSNSSNNNISQSGRGEGSEKRRNKIKSGKRRKGQVTVPLLQKLLEQTQLKIVDFASLSGNGKSESNSFRNGSGGGSMASSFPSTSTGNTTTATTTKGFTDAGVDLSHLDLLKDEFFFRERYTPLNAATPPQQFVFHTNAMPAQREGPEGDSAAAAAASTNDNIQQACKTSSDRPTEPSRAKTRTAELESGAAPSSPHAISPLFISAAPTGSGTSVLIPLFFLNEHWRTLARLLEECIHFLQEEGEEGEVKEQRTDAKQDPSTAQGKTRSAKYFTPASDNNPFIPLLNSKSAFASAFQARSRVCVVVTQPTRVACVGLTNFLRSILRASAAASAAAVPVSSSCEGSGEGEGKGKEERKEEEARAVRTAAAENRVGYAVGGENRFDPAASEIVFTTPQYLLHTLRFTTGPPAAGAGVSGARGVSETTASAACDDSGDDDAAAAAIYRLNPTLLILDEAHARGTEMGLLFAWISLYRREQLYLSAISSSSSSSSSCVSTLCDAGEDTNGANPVVTPDVNQLILFRPDTAGNEGANDGALAAGVQRKVTSSATNTDDDRNMSNRNNNSGESNYHSHYTGPLLSVYRSEFSIRQFIIMSATVSVLRLMRYFCIDLGDPLLAPVASAPALAAPTRALAAGAFPMLLCPEALYNVYRQQYGSGRFSGDEVEGFLGRKLNRSKEEKGSTEQTGGASTIAVERDVVANKSAHNTSLPRFPDGVDARGMENIRESLALAELWEIQEASDFFPISVSSRESTGGSTTHARGINNNNNNNNNKNNNAVASPALTTAFSSSSSSSSSSQLLLSSPSAAANIKTSNGFTVERYFLDDLVADPYAPCSFLRSPLLFSPWLRPRSGGNSDGGGGACAIDTGSAGGDTADGGTSSSSSSPTGDGDGGVVGRGNNRGGATTSSSGSRMTAKPALPFRGPRAGPNGFNGIPTLVDSSESQRLLHDMRLLFSPQMPSSGRNVSSGNGSSSPPPPSPPPQLHLNNTNTQILTFFTVQLLEAMFYRFFSSSSSATTVSCSSSSSCAAAAGTCSDRGDGDDPISVMVFLPGYAEIQTFLQCLERSCFLLPPFADFYDADEEEGGDLSSKRPSSSSSSPSSSGAASSAAAAAVGGNLLLFQHGSLPLTISVPVLHSTVMGQPAEQIALSELYHRRHHHHHHHPRAGAPPSSSSSSSSSFSSSIGAGVGAAGAGGRTANIRLILTTSVAESSVTIPNVKVVLDLCLERSFFASRGAGSGAAAGRGSGGGSSRNSSPDSDEPTTHHHDSNNKVVLFVQNKVTNYAPLSSLRQRAGRTGRTCDGVVIHLAPRWLYFGNYGLQQQLQGASGQHDEQEQEQRQRDDMLLLPLPLTPTASLARLLQGYHYTHYFGVGAADTAAGDGAGGKSVVHRYAPAAAAAAAREYWEPPPAENTIDLLILLKTLMHGSWGGQRTHDARWRERNYHAVRSILRYLPSPPSAQELALSFGLLVDMDILSLNPQHCLSSGGSTATIQSSSSAPHDHHHNRSDRALSPVLPPPTTGDERQKQFQTQKLLQVLRSGSPRRLSAATLPSVLTKERRHSSAPEAAASGGSGGDNAVTSSSSSSSSSFSPTYAQLDASRATNSSPLMDYYCRCIGEAELTRRGRSVHLFPLPFGSSLFLYFCIQFEVVCEGILLASLINFSSSLFLPPRLQLSSSSGGRDGAGGDPNNADAAMLIRVTDREALEGSSSSSSSSSAGDHTLQNFIRLARTQRHFAQTSGRAAAAAAAAADAASGASTSATHPTNISSSSSSSSSSSASVNEHTELSEPLMLLHLYSSYMKLTSVRELSAFLATHQLNRSTMRNVDAKVAQLCARVLRLLNDRLEVLDRQRRRRRQAPGAHSPSSSFSSSLSFSSAGSTEMDFSDYYFALEQQQQQQQQHARVSGGQTNTSRRAAGTYENGSNPSSFSSPSSLFAHYPREYVVALIKQVQKLRQAALQRYQLGTVSSRSLAFSVEGSGKGGQSGGVGGDVSHSMSSAASSHKKRDETNDTSRGDSTTACSDGSRPTSGHSRPSSSSSSSSATATTVTSTTRFSVTRQNTLLMPWFNNDAMLLSTLQRRNQPASRGDRGGGGSNSQNHNGHQRHSDDDDSLPFSSSSSSTPVYYGRVSQRLLAAYVAAFGRQLLFSQSPHLSHGYRRSFHNKLHRLAFSEVVGGDVRNCCVFAATVTVPAAGARVVVAAAAAAAAAVPDTPTAAATNGCGADASESIEKKRANKKRVKKKGKGKGKESKKAKTARKSAAANGEAATEEKAAGDDFKNDAAHAEKMSLSASEALHRVGGQLPHYLFNNTTVVRRLESRLEALLADAIDDQSQQQQQCMPRLRVEMFRQGVVLGSSSSAVRVRVFCVARYMPQDYRVDENTESNQEEAAAVAVAANGSGANEANGAHHCHAFHASAAGVTCAPLPFSALASAVSAGASLPPLHISRIPDLSIPIEASAPEGSLRSTNEAASAGAAVDGFSDAHVRFTSPRSFLSSPSPTTATAKTTTTTTATTPSSSSSFVLSSSSDTLVTFVAPRNFETASQSFSLRTAERLGLARFLPSGATAPPATAAEEEEEGEGSGRGTEYCVAAADAGKKKEKKKTNAKRDVSGGGMARAGRESVGAQQLARVEISSLSVSLAGPVYVGSHVLWQTCLPSSQGMESEENSLNFDMNSGDSNGTGGDGTAANTAVMQLRNVHAGASDLAEGVTAITTTTLPTTSDNGATTTTTTMTAVVSEAAARAVGGPLLCPLCQTLSATPAAYATHLASKYHMMNVAFAVQHGVSGPQWERLACGSAAPTIRETATKATTTTTMTTQSNTTSSLSGCAPEAGLGERDSLAAAVSQGRQVFSALFSSSATSASSAAHLPQPDPAVDHTSMTNASGTGTGDGGGVFVGTEVFPCSPTPHSLLSLLQYPPADSATSTTATTARSGAPPMKTNGAAAAPSVAAASSDSNTVSLKWTTAHANDNTTRNNTIANGTYTGRAPTHPPTESLIAVASGFLNMNTNYYGGGGGGGGAVRLAALNMWVCSPTGATEESTGRVGGVQHPAASSSSPSSSAVTPHSPRANEMTASSDANSDILFLLAGLLSGSTQNNFPVFLFNRSHTVLHGFRLSFDSQFMYMLPRPLRVRRQATPASPSSSSPSSHRGGGGSVNTKMHSGRSGRSDTADDNILTFLEGLFAGKPFTGFPAWWRQQQQQQQSQQGESNEKMESVTVGVHNTSRRLSEKAAARTIKEEEKDDDDDSETHWCVPSARCPLADYHEFLHSPFYAAQNILRVRINSTTAAAVDCECCRGGSGCSDDEDDSRARGQSHPAATAPLHNAGTMSTSTTDSCSGTSTNCGINNNNNNKSNNKNEEQTNEAAGVKKPTSRFFGEPRNITTNNSNDSTSNNIPSGAPASTTQGAPPARPQILYQYPKPAYLPPSPTPGAVKLHGHAVSSSSSSFSSHSSSSSSSSSGKYRDTQTTYEMIFGKKPVSTASVTPGGDSSSSSSFFSSSVIHTAAATVCEAPPTDSLRRRRQPSSPSPPPHSPSAPAPPPPLQLLLLPAQAVAAAVLLTLQEYTYAGRTAVILAEFVQRLLCRLERAILPLLPAGSGGHNYSSSNNNNSYHNSGSGGGSGIDRQHSINSGVAVSNVNAVEHPTATATATATTNISAATTSSAAAETLMAFLEDYRNGKVTDFLTERNYYYNNTHISRHRRSPSTSSHSPPPPPLVELLEHLGCLFDRPTAAVLAAHSYTAQKQPHSASSSSSSISISSSSVSSRTQTPVSETAASHTITSAVTLPHQKNNHNNSSNSNQINASKNARGDVTVSLQFCPPSRLPSALPPPHFRQFLTEYYIAHGKKR